MVIMAESNLLLNPLTEFLNFEQLYFSFPEIPFYATASVISLNIF